MPRFYFDIYNDLITIDHLGEELTNLEAAKVEIRRTLPSLIADTIRTKQAAQMSATPAANASSPR